MRVGKQQIWFVHSNFLQWLTDEKRRKALKQNVDLRKRIELIQDFDMPDECGTIQMSPDQQFIIATGTYKPRVKCFEVNNLSIKFERCFDSEVVRTEVLSDDYSKMVTSFWMFRSSRLHLSVPPTFRYSYPVIVTSNSMHRMVVTIVWGFHDVATIWVIICRHAICFSLEIRRKSIAWIWNVDNFCNRSKRKPSRV